MSQIHLVTNKMPAANGRFGTMAAVSPQTILCEFARYYPAGSSVEAATAPSRWDVMRQRGTAQRDNEARKENINSPKGHKIIRDEENNNHINCCFDSNDSVCSNSNEHKFDRFTRQ